MTKPIDIFRGSRAGDDRSDRSDRSESPRNGERRKTPRTGDAHSQRRAGERRRQPHEGEPHGQPHTDERRRPPHISERRTSALVAAHPSAQIITASFGRRGISGFRAALHSQGTQGSAGSGARPDRTATGPARPAPAIGIVHEPFLDDLLATHPGVVDIVSVVPEKFWTDRGRGAAHRFRHSPDDIAKIERLADQFRLAAHGVGLAFGGTSYLDVAHARELAAWAERYGCEWVSEHLPGVPQSLLDGIDPALGRPAWDDALLSTITEQVEAAQDILGAPLLLENRENGDHASERPGIRSAFLDTLTQTTGCKLLLDLHNLHLDAVNLGIDAIAFLDSLDMGSVEEIHVGAGDCFVGGRAGPGAGDFPEDVWHLLQRVVPRCRKLRCVTFEFPAVHDRVLDHDAVLAKIERARSIIVAASTARH